MNIADKTKAEDMLEVLKTGEASSMEPRIVGNKTVYGGEQRVRWFGRDQNDRIIRLIIVVKENVIVVSAAMATEPQAKIHRRGADNEKL